MPNCRRCGGSFDDNGPHRFHFPEFDDYCSSCREDREKMREQAEEAARIGASATGKGESYRKQRYKEELKGWQTYDKKDSGCCYIVSACINSLNIPSQNCLELQTICLLRTEYVIKSPRRMRELARYHKIAPRIVDSVNKRSDAKSIWASAFEEIKSVVELVRQNNFSDAYEKYSSLVSRLETFLN